MLIGPQHLGGDSDSEGCSHVLLALVLAAEGKKRERQGSWEWRGWAGERLAVLFKWDQRWQLCCN